MDTFHAVSGVTIKVSKRKAERWEKHESFHQYLLSKCHDGNGTICDVEIIFKDETDHSYLTRR